MRINHDILRNTLLFSETDDVKHFMRLKIHELLVEKVWLIGFLA